MRDVADYAHVSLGTLYHYFPSRAHLLVTALERELIRFDDLLAEGLPQAADPFTKLRAAVWGLINGMEESDRVTEALTHDHERRHAAVTDVLTDVWTSEVLALVQGRRTYAEMRRRLSAPIDLLTD